MNKKLVALAVSLAPFTSFAANYSVDARIDAMGGAGTVASDYLAAGFHNPALVALEPHSSFGVLLPTLGVQYRDPDDLVDALEDFGDVYDRFQADATSETNRTDAANALSNLQNKVAYLSGGIGGAVAVPTNSISGNLFVKAYTEAVVLPEVSDSDITAIENSTTSAPTLTSEARVLAFGLVDVGLALAGNIEFMGQRIALGVTPKTQKLYTYHYQVSVEDFNVDDWDADNNRTEESAFNMDIGAAWQNGPVRIGFAAKNLIANDITTTNRWARQYTYELKPLMTVGSAYVTDLFTMALDIDLNEQTRFAQAAGPEIKDNTQMIRFGTEFNAWGWAQARAGYMLDLEDTLDGTLTLGLGLSPFNTVHLDLAAQLIDSNSYGGSLQLAMTF
ncbi:conjugal transfer protein TraF [Enterovibrio coralii]|uniref:Conjugal transfer protein TraF n=1 Tax=Enterovibrio coralii TaxID=294935 RepID=A0A135ICK7_9GAMM|nr:conjugal transfer protein TraF [Enterovibrio coralii]KXF83193.1 hypothetical protein ATN88_05730 [Enterovibrio coralii]